VNRSNAVPGALALLALAALVAMGCAAHAPAPAPVHPAPRVLMALLPLENLSGRSEYGERFTRLVGASLGRFSRYSLAETGEVDGVLSELRIRSAGALTREQVQKTSGRLQTRWILAGTLLECGTVRTPDGDTPSFALALRLLDGRTGQVVWSDVRVRSGEDHETVFGWGREDSLDRLAAATINDLIMSIRIPDSPDSLQTPEGRP
jgi:hypothetical protein